ncbi:MAG: hypothetical protein CFE23_04250 [Flavobacterium sp. BFFFF1]|uniref:hypothetical protein n=1 Tax=Flavobacterium sp. BFFFF1 TaxID=2015557 RepID=UPI000BD199A1|nr:hypothetical protein [Flavobacterium sp. BFFFF1]OYU81687.1 MAG: hypothetical protein CFE23_04250 [Flavobacterium sp. BFFFF1]
MNTNEKDPPDHENQGNHQNELSDQRFTKKEEDEIADEKTSRHHQQEHGNRKYRMFSNHSSADDQPLTNTDTTP